MKRTRPPEVLVQAAQQWHAAGAEGCGASSASGPRPVCETGNMESAAPMIQSQRCFMIFPFESGELLICGPLPHYLKLLEIGRASCRERCSSWCAQIVL